MSQLHDLTALIRANTPLIVIETRDEERVVELFRQALMQVWRALHRWTITEGLRRMDLDREDAAEGPPDASSVLHAIRQADQRGIYLLLDFHPYLGYASHQRLLRDIVQRRGCEPHVVVLVGAKVELPSGLDAMAVRFSPRLPDAAALLKLVREEATAYAREHGGRRVAMVISRQLVYLIEKYHRVHHPGLTHSGYHPARHRTYIGAPMAPYFSLVPYAAQAHSDEPPS